MTARINTGAGQRGLLARERCKPAVEPELSSWRNSATAVLKSWRFAYRSFGSLASARSTMDWSLSGRAASCDERGAAGSWAML